jgi:hypothetical protein
MAGRYTVNPDRAGLIECLDCGHRFGARARQKGHAIRGSAQRVWVLDDKHLRCPVEGCGSHRLRKVGNG